MANQFLSKSKWSILRKVYDKITYVLIKECTAGWYGLDCKQQCSGHCRDDDVCDHVTGQCDGGCAAGWRGALCDKGIHVYKRNVWH